MDNEKKMIITDLKARLEALAAKATKGPLRRQVVAPTFEQVLIRADNGKRSVARAYSRNDAALIVELVNALPEIIAALSAAERVRELEGALTEAAISLLAIGHPEPNDPPAAHICGVIARSAVLRMKKRLGDHLNQSCPILAKQEQQP